MSYLLDGVDDRLIADQPITGDIPLTIAVWFKTPGNTANQAAAALIATDGSDDQSATLFAAGAIAGDPITFQLRTTSNLGINSTVPPAYAVDTWQHAAAVNVSTTDHRAFLNGANKGSSVTAKDITGTLTKIVLGMRGNSTSPFTGRIAEVAIWNVALSDADIALLGAGDSPMSLATAPTRYYRLKDNALDITGANGMTITGATLDADHPAVDDPPGGGTSLSVAAPAFEVTTDFPAPATSLGVNLSVGAPPFEVLAEGVIAGYSTDFVSVPFEVIADFPAPTVQFGGNLSVAAPAFDVSVVGLVPMLQLGDDLALAAPPFDVTVEFPAPYALLGVPSPPRHVVVDLDLPRRVLVRAGPV